MPLSLGLDRKTDDTPPIAGARGVEHSTEMLARIPGWLPSVPPAPSDGEVTARGTCIDAGVPMMKEVPPRVLSLLPASPPQSLRCLGAGVSCSSLRPPATLISVGDWPPLRYPPLLLSAGDLEGMVLQAIWDRGCLSGDEGRWGWGASAS